MYLSIYLSIYVHVSQLEGLHGTSLGDSEMLSQERQKDLFSRGCFTKFDLENHLT